VCASRLSAVAHYSLFPLLFQPREYPIKVLLLALYCLGIWACLQDHFTGASNGSTISERLEEAQTGSSQASTSPGKKGGAKEAAVASSRSEDGKAQRKGMLSWLERWYLLGLVLVELYASWLHAVLLGSTLPFLPLMLVSTYCAVGIGYAWLHGS
jgi:alpha-1,3-glucosyltransferase